MARLPLPQLNINRVGEFLPAGYIQHPTTDLIESEEEGGKGESLIGGMRGFVNNVER